MAVGSLQRPPYASPVTNWHVLTLKTAMGVQERTSSAVVRVVDGVAKMGK